jgi:hypothetical protein
MKHIVLVFLLVLGGTAHAQTPDPAAAANAFYAVYAAQHAQTGGGIPDATGRLRYSAVLSPRLNKQLADAAAAQRRLTAKMKNVVPPMLEGDIFSSLFEGATAWKVGACPNDGKTARCSVALNYGPPPAAGKQAAKPASWNDTLILTNTPQGWKVDDVLYDAGFAFGNTGRLTSMLQMVVAANP